MKIKNTISVRRVIVVVCTVMSKTTGYLAGQRQEVTGQSQSMPAAPQLYSPDEQRACHQADVTASGNDEVAL